MTSLRERIIEELENCEVPEKAADAILALLRDEAPPSDEVRDLRDVATFHELAPGVRNRLTVIADSLERRAALLVSGGAERAELQRRLATEREWREAEARVAAGYMRERDAVRAALAWATHSALLTPCSVQTNECGNYDHDGTPEGVQAALLQAHAESARKGGGDVHRGPGAVAHLRGLHTVAAVCTLRGCDYSVRCRHNLRAQNRQNASPR